MTPKLQCDTYATEDPGQETNTWLKIIEHLFLQTHVFLIYPPDDNYRQFYFLKNFYMLLKDGIGDYLQITQQKKINFQLNVIAPNT